MNPNLRITVPVPREIGRKLRKISEKRVLTIDAGVGNLPLEPATVFMPNQHSIDKINVSAWIDRTLAQRLRKKAKKRGEKLTELMEWLYVQATRDIELTPEDYRQIAAETERARLRQSAKRNPGKTKTARKKRGSKSE